MRTRRTVPVILRIRIPSQSKLKDVNDCAKHRAPLARRRVAATPGRTRFLRKSATANYQPYFQDVPSSAQILPWMPANALNRQRLPPKRTWSHTLYAHLYDNLDVARQLERLFGVDQGYKEPQRRTSALFALKFNDRGMMLADSLVLSSEAWFVGCAIHRKD